MARGLGLSLSHLSTLTPCPNSASAPCVRRSCSHASSAGVFSGIHSRSRPRGPRQSHCSQVRIGRRFAADLGKWCAHSQCTHLPQGHWWSGSSAAPGKSHAPQTRVDVLRSAGVSHEDPRIVCSVHISPAWDVNASESAIPSPAPACSLPPVRPALAFPTWCAGSPPVETSEPLAGSWVPRTSQRAFMKEHSSHLRDSRSPEQGSPQWGQRGPVPKQGGLGAPFFRRPPPLLCWLMILAKQARGSSSGLTAPAAASCSSQHRAQRRPSCR